MHTFTPNRIQQERGYLICLRAERDPREKRCAGFEAVVEKVYRTEMAGAWEATLFNSVAGIREEIHKSSGSRKDKRALRSYGMLGRKRGPQPRNPDLTPDKDHWEAWTMFSTGEVVTHSILESADRETSLLVTEAGPACPVGRKSVAVAFGNVVKMILLGNELYDDVDDDFLTPNVRRRPMMRKYSSRVVQPF
jgi:hypothetical protein